MKQVEIRELSAVQHLLALPGMYIGSMARTESNEMLLENGKFSRQSVKYVPALLKIINEAIDNSLDEAIKTNFKFGTKIRVSVSEDEVSIEDSGRGIPVIKSKESGEYMPVMAFCNVRAGSNFDKQNNEEAFSIGTHGIGIKATNVFSRWFKAETADGKNKLSLTCTNNLETQEFEVTKSNERYTNVYFKPDLERFGLTEIDEVHQNLIYQRILFLSYSYPKVKFYFNKKRVQIGTTKQFMSLFAENFELFSGDNWFIGVYPNDEEEFEYFSYVNGLHLKRGGSPVDLMSIELSYKIRDLLVKKYKTIKPGDVKNKLSLVIFFKDFPNMKFDSQTKETLANPFSDIKTYLGLTNEDFIDMSKKILKNTAIIEPIVEMFKLKEELKKRQALKNLSTRKRQVVSESYVPPIGNKKYLMLTEGFSATGSMLKVLGRKSIAFYSLRGKPLNTYNIPVSKMIKNQEFKDIIDILNLDLLDKNTDMDYEKVVILADNDGDGIHIRSLLLAFFYKYSPKMIEDGRICFMETPLIIASNAKDKPVKWFYSINEYNDALKTDSKLSSLKSKYYKGLGSFNKETLQEIISVEGSMDCLIRSFEKTENSGQSIKEWLSNREADSRKDFLRGREFNLSSI